VDLKLYLIHIWGPIHDPNSFQIPSENDEPDNRVLVLAENVQQANDIAYFMFNSLNSQGGEIKYLPNYQLTELLPATSMIVIGYEFSMEIPEKWLLDLEGLSAPVKIDYETVDHHLYWVELFKQSIQTEAATEELGHEKSDIAILVYAVDEQHANMLISVWAEEQGIVDTDEDVFTARVSKPILPISLWNPVMVPQNNYYEELYM